MIRFSVQACFGIILALFNPIISHYAMAEELNIAQKLGHPKDAKLLIIHADDGGLSHGTNAAIDSYIRKGYITSASFMMPCPWIYDAALKAAACEKCDTGVHVTLNSEWAHYRWGPVSSDTGVPSLIDETGALWASRELFIKHAGLEHAALELKAQIEKAARLGFKLSHIDTHMGTIYTIPGLLGAYIEIAREHRLVPMVVKWSAGLERYLAQRPEYPAAQIKRVLTELEQRNEVVMLDALITDVGGDTPDERRARYLKTIQSLKPGLSQIIVHLSEPSPEFDSIIKLRPKEARRYWDMAILKDPEFRSLLKEQQVTLIDWDDIQRVVYPQ
jgi:predicted glycoside hydrolase/deacetylase ChbG (UPF0249 family)